MNLLDKVPSLSFSSQPPQNGAVAPNLNVNLFTAETALAYTREKMRRKEGFAFATINLDHIVKLASHAKFLEAYRQHDAIVADGFPIVWLGRLSGASVRRTTGSDLTLPMIRLVSEAGGRLAMIGTTQDSLESASYVLKKKFPGLTIAFIHSPPFGFDPLSQAAQDILEQLEQSGATLCLLALGAPKQEIFAAEGRKRLPAMGFVSVGASIDFIAGMQKRAPLWIQKINMEWLWRLAINPKRFFVRYCLCAVVFPVLLFRSLRAKARRTAKG